MASRRRARLGDGRRLTHWKESVPVATWLDNIGVAQFAVRHFGAAAGVGKSRKRRTSVGSAKRSSSAHGAVLDGVQRQPVCRSSSRDAASSTPGAAQGGVLGSAERA